MVTLSKRATPSQARILKIVEGAVLNVYDAHNQKRDERFARSVAKRATGHLTSQWLEVLSAEWLTDRRHRHTIYVDAAHREHTPGVCARCGKADTKNDVGQRVLTPPVRARPKRRASHLNSRRSPLYSLWKELAIEMRHIRRSGDIVKYNLYVEILRKIDMRFKDE